MYHAGADVCVRVCAAYILNAARRGASTSRKEINIDFSRFES